MSGPIFRPPFDALDDAALLAHFRDAQRTRGVAYAPVADAEETRADKIDAIVQGRFEFNGETHALADPIDWHANPSRDVEWHILLHKFYYATGLGLAFERSGDMRYVQRWAALIDSWIAAVPPGFIAADVTGRRVQNWLYSLLLIVGPGARDSGTAVTPAFFGRLLRSLHEQVEYLCANLTPKRNHRTLELVAIFLAGVALPEMARSAHWRDFAMAQFVDNLQADLLPDGVHCELSTDYHHLVLKNALNFRRLASGHGIAVPAAFDACLQRALAFSAQVHQPDGIVPSLSDGDARSYLDLLAQGAALFGRADWRFVATAGREGTAPAERVAHFDSAGYHVVRSAWGDARRFAGAQHLVFDCGPLGEGNHGHFDCLSFTLAAHGRALVVDPGRYTYSEAPDAADGTNWRVHFRSTAAHNTVTVDGQPQTAYLPKAIKPGTRHAAGSVRHKISGPAPDAALLERHHGATLDLLHGRAASHAYDAVHERCIVFVDRAYWIVSDGLRAPGEHDYTLNFQIGAHAQGQAVLDEQADGAGLHLRTPGLLLLQPRRPGQRTALHRGWVSERYGHKQAAPALRTQVHARDADFDTVLVPWASREPRLVLRDVAVQALEVQSLDLPAGQGAPGAALRIEGEGFVDHWFHARGRSAPRWRIGGFEFSGRWAWWRCDTAGRLLRAASHDGAQLPRIDVPVATA